MLYLFEFEEWILSPLLRLGLGISEARAKESYFEGTWSAFSLPISLHTDLGLGRMTSYLEGRFPDMLMALILNGFYILKIKPLVILRAQS